MQGLIVKTHNRFYHVRCGSDVFVCSPKGSFKRKADLEYRLPVIGDEVQIELKKDQEGVDGYIIDITARRNTLIRADYEGRRERVMAANLDRAMVVSAVKKPGVDFALIDRYILTCELAEIPYALVINKMDLDADFADDPHLAVYRDLGIQVLLTSVKGNQGLEELREAVRTGISYLTGASGVGKSSLINYLAPHAQLAIGEVDRKKGRGRHTTTFSVLEPLSDEGWLVDSPGLRDFYPPKVEPDSVRFGFPEIREAQSNCKFPSCLHDGEPGCVIGEMVENGEIASFRYRSYLHLMREMRTYAQNRFN